MPELSEFTDPSRQAGVERSLKYMGLKGGEALEGIKIDKVFIGSCTNGELLLRASSFYLRSTRSSSARAPTVEDAQFVIKIVSK